MRLTLVAAAVVAALSLAVAPASATRSGVPPLRIGIETVAYSPDGSTLAVGGDDGAVRLWDLRTGKHTGSTLAGGEGAGTGTLAFSRDGSTLLGWIGAGVSAWNVATVAQVGATFGTGTTALSPDGRTLAVAGFADGVTLWNWSSHTRRGRRFGEGYGAWYGVAFSPDGRTLATAGDDGVRLWNVRTQRRIAVIEGGSDSEAVAYSPDGRLLAFNDEDGVRLWNVRTHRYAVRLLGAGPKFALSADAYRVVFSPDGRIVATVGIDVTRFWNARTGRQILPALGSNGGGGVSALAFSPDGKTFATGADDGSVTVWSTATHRPALAPFVAYPSPFEKVTFSRDGQMLAASSAGTVDVWDARTRAPIGTTIAAGDGNTFTGVAFLGDGSTLATSGDALQLWNAASGDQLGPALTETCGTVPHACAASADGIESSPDGTMFATFGASVASIWDSASHGTIGSDIENSDEVDVHAVAFSPDGHTFATALGDYGGIVRLWDIGTQHQIGDPLGGVVDSYTDPATAVAFSGDGARIAAVVHGERIWFWWVATQGQLGMSIGSPTGLDFTSVAFSPDGKLLATGSDDWTIRLWDAATGAEVGAPFRDTGPVTSVAFSPDGRTLASASYAAVRLWDVAAHAEIGGPLTGS